MKDLILGVCHGYSVDNIKNWVLSAKKYQTEENYDIVLINADENPNQELISFCSNKIEIISIASKDYSFLRDKVDKIHHQRHLLGYYFLLRLPIERSYNRVIWSDVNDVVFQSNPFSWLDNNMENYSLVIGSEGVIFNHEPWNADNITKCFPNVRQNLSDKEVLCSGIIGGYKKDIEDLLLDIYNISSSTKKHNIVDQAALNVLYYTRASLRDKTKITNTSENFVCHLAVSGPTEFFLKWNFIGNYLYDLPLNKQGIITNKDGLPYSIVHQYNRLGIEDWKEQIELRI